LFVYGVLTRDDRVPEFLDRAQGQAPTALRVEEVPYPRFASRLARGQDRIVRVGRGSAGQ
jgi:hypothetical protein